MHHPIKLNALTLSGNLCFLSYDSNTIKIKTEHCLHLYYCFYSSRDKIAVLKLFGNQGIWCTGNLYLNSSTMSLRYRYIKYVRVYFTSHNKVQTHFRASCKRRSCKGMRLPTCKHFFCICTNPSFQTLFFNDLSKHLQVQQINEQRNDWSSSDDHLLCNRFNDWFVFCYYM